MHEKPVKLPMDFGEALSRLARVPKPATKKTGRTIEISDKKGDNKPDALRTRRAAGKRKSAS